MFLIIDVIIIYIKFLSELQVCLFVLVIFIHV